ncbi:DUF4435 domain-containing protein [Bradyrhizobium sp. SZCCHNRI1001]|uniref:DUF4435 domain-containing protein n=1 Tax=unclassified Bradyrhizobium TaxID=2631580 RepID=UPI0039657B8C
MTFRRTPSALGSLHRFYGADVVVFCEGGPSLTVTEALYSPPSSITLDIVFWSAVISLLRIGSTFHLKSVGSKTTLTSIALDVEAKGITTVTVCLDSDYDRLLGAAISAKRVAYTYGYSWENDVLTSNVVKQVLSCLIGRLQPGSEQALSAELNQLESDIARWCEVDIALRAKKRLSLFNRDKPLSCADMTIKPPRLKHDALKQRLKECGYVRRPKTIVCVSASTSMRIGYGKLISRLVYHTVISLAKQVASSVRLDYETFMKMAISYTFDAAEQGNLRALASHYSNQRHAF